MKIFISHASEDKWFTDQLVALMDQHDIAVWYDKIDICVGDQFIQKIHDGLDESSHLAIILSEHSIRSRWVREELDTFYQGLVEGHKAKILPLVLDDVWQQAPNFLKKFTYADFRTSTKKALAPKGVDALVNTFRGRPVFDGDYLSCYQADGVYRLFVQLPEGKSKTRINEEVLHELKHVKSKLTGAEVIMTGRITYTLALMIGAHLANVCTSLRAFDPRQKDELVPIFLPS